MENNDEIMVTNDEVNEIEEIETTTGVSNGVKIGVGVGLAVLLGGIAYKRIGKPIVAKIKAKRKQRKIDKANITIGDGDEADSSIDE